MIKVHKICLEANNKQKTYFAKACGTARFAYNWALDEWQKQYKNGDKPSEAKLRKKLNALKREEFPWMLEVTKVAPQQAIKNLGDAFNKFFTKQNEYPTFKKKGFHDSFRADNGPKDKNSDAVKIIGKKIQLPIIGWVKLTEKLRFKGQIKSVVISRTAGRWYAAISVDTNETITAREKQGVAGVDLGITTLATLSTGKEIAAIKPYNSVLKKIKRFNRKLSRRKLDGVNRKKAKFALAKLHAHVVNVRHDTIHKLTAELARNFDGVCIEDLNVKGMQKNRKLSRHIQDCGFYEFRRQLTYKCKWYNTNLVVADRFFASSKICNDCDYKNDSLQLIERIWQCSSCHKVHKRDLNASCNLENYYYKSSSTASFVGINACGKESSGSVAIVTA